MPIILVVDDSKTDRALIGGLLKPHLEWVVQYAENGAEALDMIGSVFPDIVVTDLQMPTMNGIDLCIQSKLEYPHVPIVIVTGQGSEQLAVDALKAGAASYVPKSALQHSLLETVEQVLAISKHEKSKDLIMTFMTSTRYQFNLETDQSLISPTIHYFCNVMESLKLLDKIELRHVSVAIEEALINAMFNGNLELDGTSVQTARRAMHDGRIAETVLHKMALPPFNQRRVRVGFEVTRKTLEIVVRDEGEGFDWKNQVKLANDNSQLSGAGGRGLTLIHNFMDDVQFNDKGNEIRMGMKVDLHKSIAKAAKSATN